MKEKRVIIVHGYDGGPDRDWLPWFAAELRSRGIAVAAPVLPEPTAPDFDRWMATIAAAAGTPDEHTHFVAHSLGVPALIHYLASLPEGVKVGSALFVAGAMGKIDDPEIAPFSIDEVLVRAARAHLSKAVLMRSDNDPIISLERSDAFSHALMAEEIWEKGKGHFSEDWNVFELPKGLEAVLAF